MESITNSTMNMIQRLASTIPTPSEDQSTLYLLQQTISQVTTNTNHRKDLLILTIIVILALELLSKLVYHVPSKKSKSIPVRGKHLDDFSTKDWIFIGVNKCMTGIFVYVYFGYLWGVRKEVDHHHHDHHDREESTGAGQHHHDCCTGGSGIWNTADLSTANTLLPLPFLFIIYDFFYTLLHWLLHVKGIYKYVHKHHHHQKAPSRANLDAVNVHPLEFFLGEFNHVLALHLVVRGVPMSGGFWKGMDVSWVGAALFLGVGGAVAGLNHTRHDVVFRIPSWSSLGSSLGSSNNDDEEGKNTKSWITVFDSKHHDVHHRIPQSNYGQYSVLWDRYFGTFREYDENDRVNPDNQLDVATGKTVVKSRKKE